MVKWEQLANSRLRNVERLFDNEKVRKGGDREMRKDNEPLVRGWDG